MASQNIKNMRFLDKAHAETPSRLRGNLKSGERRDKIKFISVSFVPLCLRVILFSLVFVSCQTTQSPDSFFNEGIMPLASGANLYIVANVSEAKPVLELLPIEELKNPQVKDMLNRSNYAMAALYPRSSGKRFQMAAWGNYPNAGADMALTVNNNWKRQSASGKTYWHSGSDRLSISMTSKQAFVLGTINNAPVDPFAKGAEIPADFNEFRKGAALSCWLNNPGNSIQQMLNNAGIPIRTPVRQFFININVVNKTRKQYEAVLRLSFDNASQANGIITILKVASVVAPGASNVASIFLSNTPVQDGANIIIRTNTLSESLLVNVLKMISSIN